MGWREQCKKTTNDNPPNTQASPQLPRNYFSVGLAKKLPKRSYCITKVKRRDKNICHRPSSSLKIARVHGLKFSLHSPALNLLSTQVVSSCSSSFQSSCLKPHPQLHKQRERAYRGKNRTCLLRSVRAEVCARKGYEHHRRWYGLSPVPPISTALLLV